jgi:4-coumarate--CoA ligase
MLNKRPNTRKYDLSSLESILCGAAPLSRELQNEVAARFKVDIIQGWGMTEVVCGGLMNPGGSKDDTGSVGVLLPNMEAKLIDDDGNESCERGELLVRGPNVFLRYWKNDSATKESIGRDGWFTTGDVVIVNKKGKFWIIDRKKVRICQISHTGMSHPMLGTYQSQRTSGGACRA